MFFFRRFLRYSLGAIFKPLPTPARAFAAMAVGNVITAVLIR